MRDCYYECIEKFEVPKYDDDIIITGEFIKIEKGSEWEREEYSNIDSDVGLVNLEDATWLGISEERLEKHFKKCEWVVGD